MCQIQFISPFTIFSEAIIHLTYPPKFYQNIVPISPGNLIKLSQRKSKTMVMQNLGGKQGALWSQTVKTMNGIIK